MGRKVRREAAPRRRGGADLSRFYRVLTVVAVIGVAAVGYSLVAAGVGTPAMAPVQPAVEREYVASGRARLVVYDLPLVQIHAKAFIAARAARCADSQDRFWDYHDALYDKQPEWVGRANPIEAFIPGGQ